MNCNPRNYHKELETLIEQQVRDGKVPSLLLHGCCAPCSSYCIEYLSQYFHITMYFYNPNISEKEEYDKRVEELRRLIASMPVKYPVKLMEGEYHPEEFYAIAKGYEQCPEGSERCFRCYELRIRSAADICKKLEMDYFTTTLSISPLKNAEKLNEIGERVAKEMGLHYLVSDFKKKDGYKRSIELSGEYDLYRQNYCGCAYSKAEALKRDKKTEQDRNGTEK